MRNLELRIKHQAHKEASTQNVKGGLVLNAGGIIVLARQAPKVRVAIVVVVVVAAAAAAAAHRKAIQVPKRNKKNKEKREKNRR